MRISTNMMFESGSTRLSEMQTNLAKVQDQISTGRRILTPADDPVAAAQALVVSQSKAANEQLAINRQNAAASLSLEESVLQGVTSLLQDVKTLVVQAGNPALDAKQRQFIATELSGIRDEMLSLANSRDGAGNYLFSGFQTNVQPFAQTATGAQYNGDQGQRMAQVGSARKMPVSDTGAAIFESAKTGNGTFVTGANPLNTGTGVASTGSIANAAALTGNNYSITFTAAPGTPTTYAVVNTTTGATLSAANPYTSGESITFDGIQFDIKGSPANGDQFTVRPSGNQSVFASLTELVNLLNAPVNSPADQARLTMGLAAANNNAGNALDNVLTVRASVGIRLKEMENLNSQGEDVGLQYAQQLEELQGLDYTKAITELSKQKIMLEAAQQSFVKTSSLSLFKLI